MILKVYRSATLSGGIVTDLNESKSVGHSFSIIHMQKCDGSATLSSSFFTGQNILSKIGTSPNDVASYLSYTLAIGVAA